MSPRNRVLMVVPQYPPPVTGGLEKQAHELARYLVAGGAKVGVLSTRFAPGQPRRSIVDDVPVLRTGSFRNPTLRSIITPILIALRMAAARNTYDIVHVHQNSWISVIVLLVARALGKKTVAKLANVGEFGLPGMRRSRFGRYKVAWFTAADVIVAMSGESLAEVATEGVPLDRVLVTPNGIALAQDGPSRETQARETLTVVFVGRISDEKRIDVLLRAWKILVSRTSRDVSLVLLGEGPLEAEMADLARDLGIQDSVTFCGRVSDVPRRLAQADIFVLPSQFEGNSNAILEAMAAGLPIVSTLVGGTAMQVGPEGRPFLLVPGDEDGLAEAIRNLVEDAGLRLGLGQAMRRRVEEHFDMKVVAATYRDAYNLLALGRGGEMPTLANPVVGTVV